MILSKKKKGFQKICGIVRERIKCDIQFGINQLLCEKRE